MKNIFFDMDWTLYSFENWKYSWSILEKQVQTNVVNLLKQFEPESYKSKFEIIKTNYWEEFSIAFEQLFWINKNEYFNITWDIYPDKYILDNRWALDVFQYLKWLNYNIYIVSESPKIWINRVLKFLNVDSIISWIYSWQNEERKSNGLLYKKITTELWNDSYMIWDQINSDIVMAKKYWFKTMYINKLIDCNESDYNLIDLTDIYNIITE